MLSVAGPVLLSAIDVFPVPLPPHVVVHAARRDRHGGFPLPATLLRRFPLRLKLDTTSEQRFRVISI
jgi:MoxR-like ATPase